MAINMVVLAEINDTRQTNHRAWKSGLSKKTPVNSSSIIWLFLLMFLKKSPSQE